MRCFGLFLLLPGLTAQDPPIAFEHVKVVPMDREVVLDDQTVVVQHGAIVGLGHADEVEIPAGSQRIDGRDSYLMPGLHDMHVHLTDPADLILYLVHGVTTVRNMWGGPDTLDLREKIRSGDALGPRIFTTGPIMDGEDPAWRGSPVLTDVRVAILEVEAQQAAGYDAFKVYDGLRREVYDAALERARELDLPVVGHVPVEVGLRVALERGQRSVEHLAGYRAVDPDDIPELARITAASETWNCPTLVVFDLPWRALRDLDAARNSPEVGLVPPSVRARWDPAADERFGGITEMTPELWSSHLAGMQKLYAIVRELRDAGAPLLLGTDTPNPFVVPGYSVHQELEQLVAAGLTPFQALQAGTVHAAQFLSGDDAGSIAVGQRADLLLLGANPLERVRSALDLRGVMIAGRWMGSRELDERLAELVAGYRPPADWFEGIPALQAGEPLRFEVFWNDTQIGADRFVLASGEDGRVLHAQSVLRDQFQDLRISSLRTRLEGGLGLLISVWSGEQRGEVRATHRDGRLVLSGTLPHGPQVELNQAVGDGVLLGTGILPHALTFSRRLSELAIGRQTSIELRTPEFSEGFEVSHTVVAVTRTDDTFVELAGRHLAVRAFSLTMTTGQYTTPATLTVDADGIPVTLELVFQQGRKIFRRVE